MNDPYDPDQTADFSSSVADSLDAGLAAGFGRPADAPSSVLSGLRERLGVLRPVLLQEAEGESAHIIKPHSDAMPLPEQTGDRYQLQGEIARGGMGAVLRGRDVDLGRDLAVKVLLEQYANRPDVVRRFLDEAQVGAQLQHPGVVPVYDIGRFGDRPFFTMKLVKGQTLAALLTERTDPGTERPRFLGIALQVAQTVAYAHAKGVIHRDLKPANIMVGAFGEVQVMDWGLAKVLAEGGVADEERQSRERHRAENVTQIRTARSTGSGVGTDTEAGSLLGTPAYMSPEQANGDIAHLDRRADVFGLGAILCEILTGKPPYVGRSSEEVRRKAANGDLADATARPDSCGADSELIVLTKACLSPEAIDRPKDAQAVVDGLAAYLDGVQERLHQAELAEAEARAKAIEEVKRRRLTLVLAATVLLALTLGGGGWLWVKNERAARQAQVTHEVNGALSQATAFREQAKAATVGSMPLFAQAREHAQRALALVENGPADAALTDQVQQLKAELDEEEKDRVLLSALDEARLKQAETLSHNMFASERAVPLFREALRAYGLPVGEGDPTAIAQRIRQRPAAVREAIIAALDEWDVLAGKPKIALVEPHRDWLRAVLSATEPEDAWTRQVRDARAEKDKTKRRAALAALAASVDVKRVPIRALTRLAQLGAVDQEDALEPAEAAKLLRRAQAHYPADFWVNNDLGWALLKVTPPQYDEAVRFLTAAVALRPESPGALLNLGSALDEKGQVDEAIACFKRAITLDPVYAAAHDSLGTALMHKGRVNDAIECYHKALDLDPMFAHAHNNLGGALRAKGQVDEAIVCSKKALALDPNYAHAHNNLGNDLLDKGQVDEAIACYKKAIALDLKYANAHNGLGNALKAKGQVDEAIVCYKKAIVLDPKEAAAHHNLGDALRETGQLDEAIRWGQKAIELDPRNGLVHTSLGLALKAKGKPDEAIACHKKAIELDPGCAPAHLNLGNALQDKGELDAAIDCYKKAIELDPKYATAHNNLGNVLKTKGRVDEAIAEYKKAIDLNPKFAVPHRGLGVILSDFKRDYAGAIACYQKAIALDPKDPFPHVSWGAILCDVKRNYDGAIACFRKAIELDPKYAIAHNNLGLALAHKQQFDRAITCYKKAIELDPKFARAYLNQGLALTHKGQREQAIISFKKAIELDQKLASAHSAMGRALYDKGQVEEAIPCYRKATELDPKDAAAHYDLGNLLKQKGQLDEAIACYKKATDVEPNYAEAHCNLGSALQLRGRYAESLAAYQRGDELGSKRIGWPYPSAEWVRQAKRLAALEARLPAVIKGELQPKGTVRLEFLAICQAKQFHYAAARLYAEALAADPPLADDLHKGHRYNAACFAALAAAGQGKDAVMPDDKERTRLRQQALDWLRADLAGYTKLWESDPAVARSFVRDHLKHWQEDTDLVGIRGEAALAKLPTEERAPFTQLWADVAALLKKAQLPAQKESK
jgi:serine/threonine-protein kinase